MSKYRLLVPAVIAALVGGCTMIPKYTRPEAPVPATLPSGGAYGQAPATQAAARPAWEIPWQDFFADERLAKVIAMALDNNRDLRLAALNVERARGLYGIQSAELLPTVNGTGAMSRRRTPANFNGSDTASTSTQYNVDLGVASWEIDFFGRIRSLKEAALQQYLATEQARRSAQILLISAVADGYLRLAADRENLQLAQTTLDSQQSAYDLVRRRYERGLTTELDLYRAQTQVDTARVDLGRFTQSQARDENALTLLVGAPVAPELMPANLAAVTAPQDIVSGISSEVLLQRPDILQAEDLLKSANANIGAARAAFFPRISLTAAVGTVSNELSGLFQSGSGTWNYGPQIVVPIFDARVWAAKRVSETDKKIAVAQYERAIQASFREVADALATRGTADQQVASQESLVKAVSETYRLSAARYERGIDSYLSVLDAQRSLYSAQRGLVLLRLEKLVNQVTLYAVFGGGWQTPADLAAATQPAPTVR